MNTLRPLHRMAISLCLALGTCAAFQAQAQVKTEKLQVLSAQAGLVGPPAGAALQFIPSAELPLADGQEFGWRVTLKTTLKHVRVREELTLPAEPKTWGDPEPGVKRKTSPDGRTATTEWLLEPTSGVIQSTWTVTSGDPKGSWVLKLWIEDQPVQVLRLQAR